MDFVEGETLLKKRGGKDRAAAFGHRRKSLFLPTIQAMAEVHRHGIVHRDISPDNLMVTAGRQAKDCWTLGAAKDLERSGTGRQRPVLQMVAKGASAPSSSITQRAARPMDGRLRHGRHGLLHPDRKTAARRHRPGGGGHHLVGGTRPESVVGAGAGSAAKGHGDIRQKPDAEHGGTGKGSVQHNGKTGTRASTSAGAGNQAGTPARTRNPAGISTKAGVKPEPQPTPEPAPQAQSEPKPKAGKKSGKKLWIAAAAVIAVVLCGALIWANATKLVSDTSEPTSAPGCETLGHSWQSATCTAPRTCTRCGETSGSALGHDWPTMEELSYCSRCNEPNGSLELLDPSSYKALWTGQDVEFTLDNGKRVTCTIWDPALKIEKCYSLTLCLQIDTYSYGNIKGEWGFYIRDLDGAWHLADTFTLSEDYVEAHFEFDEPISFDAWACPCHVLGNGWNFSYSSWLQDVTVFTCTATPTTAATVAEEASSQLVYPVLNMTDAEFEQEVMPLFDAAESWTKETAPQNIKDFPIFPESLFELFDTLEGAESEIEIANSTLSWKTNLLELLPVGISDPYWGYFDNNDEWQRAAFKSVGNGTYIVTASADALAANSFPTMYFHWYTYLEGWGEDIYVNYDILNQRIEQTPYVSLQMLNGDYLIEWGHNNWDGKNNFTIDICTFVPETPTTSVATSICYLVYDAASGKLISVTKP